jgi:hypothetical protein
MRSCPTGGTGRSQVRGIDDVIDAAEPWPYTDLDFVFAEHQKETPKAFASRRR